MPARRALRVHSLLTNPVPRLIPSLTRLLVYAIPPLAFRVVNHSRAHAPTVVPCPQHLTYCPLTAGRRG